MLRTLLGGALAGLSASVVMERAGSVLYERESDEARRREEDGRADSVPTTTLVKKTARVLRHDVDQERADQLGMVAHYAFGAAGGPASALVRRAGVDPVKAGLLTGLAMWAVVDEGFNAAAAPAERFALVTHVRALAAHVVYGLTVGLLLAAGDRTR